MNWSPTLLLSDDIAPVRLTWAWYLRAAMLDSPIGVAIRASLNLSAFSLIWSSPVVADLMRSRAEALLSVSASSSARSWRRDRVFPVL